MSARNSGLTLTVLTTVNRHQVFSPTQCYSYTAPLPLLVQHSKETVNSVCWWLVIQILEVLNTTATTHLAVKLHLSCLSVLFFIQVYIWATKTVLGPPNLEAWCPGVQCIKISVSIPVFTTRSGSCFQHRYRTAELISLDSLVAIIVLIQFQHVVH